MTVIHGHPGFRILTIRDTNEMEEGDEIIEIRAEKGKPIEIDIKRPWDEAAFRGSKEYRESYAYACEKIAMEVEDLKKVFLAEARSAVRAAWMALNPFRG